MSLKEQIENDSIRALKEKNETVLTVLRMLKSAIRNAEIAKQTEFNDGDIMSVIQSQIKQRQDSINLYEQGDRQELADKEKTEIEILQKYLPEQMTEAEIREIVNRALDETGAMEIKDMGKVMTKIMPQIKGRADGSLVSKIVKEELTR